MIKMSENGKVRGIEEETVEKIVRSLVSMEDYGLDGKLQDRLCNRIVRYLTDSSYVRIGENQSSNSEIVEQMGGRAFFGAEDIRVGVQSILDLILQESADERLSVRKIAHRHINTNEALHELMSTFF